MTEIDRQVRRARQRLFANQWVFSACWSLTAAGGALAAVIIFARLYGFEWPLGLIAASLAGAGLLAGTIWSLAVRPSIEVAAATLDQAAGLRERISTGLYCQSQASLKEDSFAQAVVADADRWCGNISVRQHIRLRAPFALAYSGMAFVVAGLCLLIPFGSLVSAEENRRSEAVAEARQVDVVVRKKLDELKKQVATNPALKDLKEEIDKLEAKPPDDQARPDNVRHEGIKKIERFGDVLKQRREDQKFDQVSEVKKMLRALTPPGESKTPVEKLTKALAEGDHQTAQEQIKDLQEKLAKMDSPEDQAKAKELGKQLEDLAKKLADVAKDKQLEQKLEQAGIKKEDIERMLQQLSKKDLEQLRKELEKQGLKQKDIDKLADQLQKRQQASQMAKQLGEAMKQASQSASQGQSQSAQAALDSAADQLSNMEMLEQEMNQLDSMISEAQQAQSELDSACKQCNGTGQCNGKECSKCNGDGGKNQGKGGMGQKPGQGRGGVAPEEQTGVAFKTERTKVKTGQGRIIGRILIDGEQVPGEVNSEVSETIAAEERIATESINRDEVPRQHQKAVKEYFSTLTKKLAKAGTSSPAPEGTTSPKPESDDAESDE